jgi:hypothetical protein
MDLLNILNDNPELAKGLRLEVSGSDLIAFGEHVAERAIERMKMNQQPDVEEYMKPQAFAKALGISLVTLWNYDKKKLTKPLRIGGQKRYRRSDLEKILGQA